MDSDSASKIILHSELSRIDGTHAEIAVSVTGDKMPIAIAFFDIDKTLAHLDILYKEAIHQLFPNEDKYELAQTFFAGFKLGNSFREFDRMHEIYVNGVVEWKDPEVYRREQKGSFWQMIDTPGNEIHDRARDYLNKYAFAAASIADDVYKKDPGVFLKARIDPLYILLEIYRTNGILCFGFTANPKLFVEKMAMYIGLSDYFLSIATDETMEGGGKEVAIKKLLESVVYRGLQIPKSNLIFVGDSIRGDIGSGVLFCKNNPGYSGHGILVIPSKTALMEFRHLVNTDKEISSITSEIPVYAFVIDAVPRNPDGKPSLLSRDMPKFLFKL